MTFVPSLWGSHDGLEPIQGYRDLKRTRDRIAFHYRPTHFPHRLRAPRCTGSAAVALALPGPRSRLPALQQYRQPRRRGEKLQGRRRLDHRGELVECIGTHLRCTLLRGELVARYYYIYAIDYDRGGEWSGHAYMCTRDKEFTIRGTEDCLARGYDKTGFFESIPASSVPGRCN